MCYIIFPSKRIYNLSSVTNCERTYFLFDIVRDKYYIDINLFTFINKYYITFGYPFQRLYVSILEICVKPLKKAFSKTHLVKGSQIAKTKAPYKSFCEYIRHILKQIAAPH